jgi:hypothetical protein
MIEFLTNPWFLFAFAAILNVLQFVAPRTKTTVDDKLRDGMEAVKPILPKQPPKV